jgi:hypothetical protein
MNDSDEILHTLQTFVPTEYTWSLNGISGLSIEASKNSELIELLMCLGRLMRDKEGKVVRYVLPPALAVAIIAVMDSKDPLRTAREMMRECLAQDFAAVKRMNSEGG